MDDLIEKVGSFGRYQKGLLLIIGAVTGLNGITQFVSVFNNAVPKLLCQYKKLNNSFDDDGPYLPNSCEIFKNISLSKENNQEPLYECRYDTTYYGRSVVTEYDLICDRLYLSSLTQTIFMVGSMTSFVSGYLSDQYGRKKVCLYICLLLFSSILISEIVQIEYFNFSIDFKYSIYLLLSYMLGFTNFSLDIITYVLIIEFTTKRHVNFVTIFNMEMYVLGELVLLLISYYFRDWHVHNWFVAGISLTLALMIVTILPESPK